MVRQWKWGGGLQMETMVHPPMAWAGLEATLHSASSSE